MKEGLKAARGREMLGEDDPVAGPAREWLRVRKGRCQAAEGTGDSDRCRREVGDCKMPSWVLF